MPEKKNGKIGAGWVHEKNGVRYVSCTVKIEGKEYSFSLLPNTYKEHEKQPDYNVLMGKKD